eukprot:CAMPEP_0198728382 /NCGR_PEP_ID=MMETSP1475-20131203/8949_1 /TAXON_ID= ORGANISM="Unidentified sp., Strain CCMP1999" /NCGR_SAMPLE_ID=MMETSP1475 /ASSEMBLY_ACC=CAM_ASM_001111 /LENGTH=600 /DNA_ID=CAMNT_0044490731 /DNA_START=44 /DNA_END=1847 /DNA_ORIENTATION=-
MSELAVAAAGTYQPVHQLSLNLAESLCVPSVVIEDEPLDSSPLGSSSVAYPGTAVSFGDQCSGDDAALAFLNKDDALTRSDVQGHVAALAQMEGINSIAAQVLTFSMVVAFLFPKDPTCGSFSVPKDTSLGVIFTGEDAAILDTKLNPDAKYLAYLSYSMQDGNPELNSFCSYTDTPLESTTDGAPSVDGTYTPLLEGSNVCLQEVSLGDGLTSQDSGGTYILSGSDIQANGNQCSDDGALVFMLYKDVQDSAALSNLLGRLEGSNSLELLNRIAADVPEEDLYAYLKSGSLDCGGANTDNVLFGLYFEAKEDGRIGGILGVKEGNKYLAAARLTSGSNEASAFCYYFAEPNSAPGGGGSGGDGSDGGDSNGDPTDEPEASPTDGEESPEPTAIPTSEPCFPASATVELEGGLRRRMDELVSGDRVRTGADKFSEIFFFSHRDSEGTASYVLISVENGLELALSEKHYLYANDKLTAAFSVHVGDTVTTAHGKRARVLAVNKASLQGVFAPHTLDGDIVVNDVRASCYTQVVHPVVAHLLLAPLRAAHRLGVPMPKFFEKQAGRTWHVLFGCLRALHPSEASTVWRDHDDNWQSSSLKRA